MGTHMLANDRTHHLGLFCIICISHTLAVQIWLFRVVDKNLENCETIFLICCNLSKDHLNHIFFFPFFSYLGIYFVCNTFPGTVSYGCFVSQCGKLPF